MSGSSFSCSSLIKGLIMLVLILVTFEFIYGTLQTNNFDYSGFILRQNQERPHLVINNTANDSKSYFFIEIGSCKQVKTAFRGVGFEKKWKTNSNIQRSFCIVENLSNLGRIPVLINTVPKAYELEREFHWLSVGGHYKPKDCIPQMSVALIIPFRCRAEHLLIFLRHMHPFLKRQKLDYSIFVIEQDDEGPFNRGMLMNVGFEEALKHRNYDCFIFHDVDLLPEDDQNLYTCATQPRHMSVAVNTFNYKLPYSDIFGGASAITREQFELLNGFSNSFWGWGAEDDDMSNRIAHHNLTICRYPASVARYKMLKHKKGKPNPNKFNVLKKGKTEFETDGLNSLKYEVLNATQKLLYTWILVSLKK